MNNFDGLIHNYPEICVDNFVSTTILNARIKLFILTHFHDDHMHGLEDMKFYKILQMNKSKVKFYCSSITRQFIGMCDKYRHLHEYCSELACEVPVSVPISDTENVTISFYGSGHCPGSVMVFIEGSRGNILFTGDFRLPLNSANRLQFLKIDDFMDGKCNNKRRKLIDTLYIDMTFFRSSIKCLPTREESVHELIKFIKSFICNNSNGQKEKNLIYMKTGARIGYEYVYQEIYHKTGFKVHVNELIYRLYDELPQIQQGLTLDPHETPIHSCIYEMKKRDEKKIALMNDVKSNRSIRKSNDGSGAKVALPCTTEDHDCARRSVNAVKIIMSTMWFVDTAGIDQIFLKYVPNKYELDSPAYKPYRSVYRLCFSFHSSFEEIVDFVSTIKPKKLKVIALPECTTERDVNEKFYADDGSFRGYLETKPSIHGLARSNSQTTTNSVRHQTIKTPSKLLLRKRKSMFDKSSNNDSSEESSDSDDDFNFGEKKLVKN